MNELINFNIQAEGERLTLSARDLHKALQITERFSSWFDRMKAYGFDEDSDYTSVKSFTEVPNNEGDDK